MKSSLEITKIRKRPEITGKISQAGINDIATGKSYVY